MNRRSKVALIAFVSLALAAAIFIPVLSGPASRCGGNVLCIPDQKQSLSLHYLGFGAESSYSGQSYYICKSNGCTNSWTGP